VRFPFLIEFEGTLFPPRRIWDHSRGFMSRKIFSLFASSNQWQQKSRSSFEMFKFEGDRYRNLSQIICWELIFSNWARIKLRNLDSL